MKSDDPWFDDPKRGGGGGFAFPGDKPHVDRWWESHPHKVADAEQLGVDPKPRRGTSPWFFLAAAGFIIFELTSDPALTVVVGCVKFGWDELATARWLRRNDPDRRRGRIVGRFYTAWSLWKISMVAAAMMFLIVAIFGVLSKKAGIGPGLGQPPPGFSTAISVAILGFVASALTSIVAVLSAWRNGTRVWLGHEARAARREGVWPPSWMTLSRSRGNRVPMIILSALITITTALGMFLLLAPLGGPGKRIGATGGAVVLAMMFVLPVFLLVAREFFAKRIAAKTPWECWPDGTDADSTTASPRGVGPASPA